MSFKFRPFAVLGFTVLLSLFAIFYFNYNLSVFFISAGGLLLLITYMFRSLREKLVPMYVAGAMIIAGISSYFTYNDTYNLSHTYVDKSVSIEGIITDEPDYSNFRYYYIIDLDKIDGQPVDSKLRLSLPYELDAEPFDLVSLQAKIYKIASQSREMQHYYYSKGVFLGAYILDDDDAVVNVKRNSIEPFELRLFKIRENLISNIYQKLPNEYGSTVVAMLLGDKSGLTDERTESFREAGVAPIFAVSGLHLSIWVMGLYAILDKFNIKKKVNSIIGITFTVIFMYLAGLSPSVCRSGLMMLLLLSANLFNRKSDSLNSLGFAAFVLCLSNPFTAVDTGFLLSFSATLAIVTIAPLADKYLFSKIPENFVGYSLRSLLTSIAVSLSASVGVLPVTILFIGRISVYSALSNILLSPIATVCMVTGGLCAITFKAGFISDFFALISGLFSKFMLFVIDFICDTSVTTFSVDNLFWKSAAICSVCVLIFVVITFKGKNAFKALCVGLAVVTITFGLSSYYYYNGLTQVRILNVGDGISAVAYDNNSKVVLSGKADNYLKPLKLNDKIKQISSSDPDMLILAEKEAAYDSANLNLMKSFNYATVVLPETNTDVETISGTENVIETSCAAIDVFNGDNIRFNIQKEYSLAYCKFSDTTFLMLFDSYKNAEIPKEYLSADYLICCGYIPACIKPSAYENVIICGQEERILPIYNYVISCGGNPIIADDYEEIVINVREDKHKLFLWEEW